MIFDVVIMVMGKVLYNVSVFQLVLCPDLRPLVEVLHACLQELSPEQLGTVCSASPEAHSGQNLAAPFRFPS